MRRRLGRDQQPEERGWHGKLVVVHRRARQADGGTRRGIQCIQQLLSGLKNLLTARGVHFLFVAGPDLHDVVLRREAGAATASTRACSGGSLYVPCLWEGTEGAPRPPWPSTTTRTSPSTGALRNYLAFKSRGVPRLLLMRAQLRSCAGARARAAARGRRARISRACSSTPPSSRIISDFVGGPPGDRRPFTPAIDEDRWRLRRLLPHGLGAA